MTKYMIGVIICLALGLVAMTKINDSNVRERDRLSENQAALLSDIRFYKMLDSLSVGSVQQLIFTTRELKQHRQELIKTIDGLNLKLKRVQAVSSTSIKSNSKIQTIIRDSIRTLASRTDTLRCINYTDKWLTISGCQENNEFTGIIESRNTIDQVIHRVPHKFLFFRWGAKAIRQEVVSRNQNSEITFTEYIELKK